MDSQNKLIKKSRLNHIHCLNYMIIKSPEQLMLMVKVNLHILYKKLEIPPQKI